MQASISFFRMKRHSRNVEKKGWWEIMQSDVKEWLRIFDLFLDALGDGE